MNSSSYSDYFCTVPVLNLGTLNKKMIKSSSNAAFSVYGGSVTNRSRFSRSSSSRKLSNIVIPTIRELKEGIHSAEPLLNVDQEMKNG